MFNLIIGLFLFTVSLSASKLNSCGCPAAADNKPGNRMINGFQIEAHEAPYQVNLEGLEGLYNVWRHACGGTILNRRWILTSARCITRGLEVTFKQNYPKKIFRVSVGQKDICPQKQINYMKIEKFLRHDDYKQDYKRQLFDNDIGLLKLASDLEFNDNVRPACLPTSEMDYSNIIGLATGWWTDHFNKTCTLEASKQSILKSDDPMCINGTDHKVDKTKMCSYNYKSCPYGVYGGPLIVTENGKHTVVGIISGLQAEGSKIYAPNVYTRVSAYLDWINQNIQDGEC